VHGYDEYKNAEHLQRKLKYWPEPIEVLVEPVPDNWDDPVPF